MRITKYLLCLMAPDNYFVYRITPSTQRDVLCVKKVFLQLIFFREDHFMANYYVGVKQNKGK